MRRRWSPHASPHGVMNILLVTGIFPPDIGGPATYVPFIAAGLESRGHDIRVITWADAIGAPDGVLPYPVIRIRRRASRLIRGIRTLWLIARHGASADVLFVCGLDFYAALANVFIGKPLVIRIVGDLAWERSVALRLCQQDFETFQRARHALGVRFLQRLQRWWLRRADFIIVPSRYLLQWVTTRNVSRDRIAVIHNAVEEDRSGEAQRAALGTGVNLITAGRLIPLKRIDEIIAAVAELDGVGLVVVGEGAERRALEQLASKLQIRERVLFAGQLDNRDLRRLMKGCDIFVLNSVHEGFPFALLEAMSTGLPVVANPVGGIPEIVENGSNGLLVDAATGGLVSALRRLVECEELRRRLGENARAFIRSRFDPQVMLDRTEELLTRARMSEHA